MPPVTVDVAILLFEYRKIIVAFAAVVLAIKMEED
jgi:hypothetical protein